MRESGAGFTIIEVLIYIAIVSFVVLSVSSFIFYLTYSNAKTKGDREVMENARRALEIIMYEIHSAKSIYTPTTTTSQLSLETSKYLPQGETTTYIDFFLCGSRLCLKKESQEPIFLTSDTVEVTNITFTQIAVNNSMSIKISITVNYQDAIKDQQPSVTLTSTASLRNN